MEYGTVREFSQDWFNDLSRRAPVQEMLPRLASQQLEMAFPERTLYSHDDFVDWYAAVGDLFTDQEHVLERLEVEDRGAVLDLDVTVVWKATHVRDGSRTAFRIDQQWQLQKGPGDALRILKYRVGDLRPVEAGR
ncbi:nuclear transport factor 2 family protein [Streptomyces sp. NPDC003697]